MKIDGPLSVSVVDDEVQQKRTLEITFKNEFHQLSLEQRVSNLKQYIQSLYQNSQSLNDQQTDKTGLILIMQLCEQLLPYVQQDELDLSDTIQLDMSLGGGGSASEISVSLSDLILN